MNKRALWLYLLAPVSLSLLTILFAGRYSVVRPHIGFYYLTTFCFTMISILGMIAAFRTTANRNKSLFGSMALTITLAKIIVAVALAIIYVQVYPGVSHWFILPFFLIYLYFTIYETFALIQIGRHPYE